MNDDTLPFVDLLFNLLLGYAFLFLVSFMLIQPIVKKADISTQAEFIITVTWPLDNIDDVDTWVQDPLENIVYFKNKEAGLTHIDRDDLGSLNDTIYLSDGSKIVYPYNQEITTIRGFIGGEWILNLHMYSKRTEDPTVVTVKVDKLNPKFNTVLTKDIILSDKGEEVTVARFDMTSAGDILSINDLPKGLIKYGIAGTVSGGGPDV